MITLTLEEAQNDLQKLAHRAAQGEIVFITIPGTNSLLSLQSVQPELPPNYLAQCYGPEERAEEDHLATFAPRGIAT
jgi:hypothetical protein